MTDGMTTPARDEPRIAAHEAGHVAAGWYLLGIVPPAVSIERAASFHGVTLGHLGRIVATGHDREAPIVLARPGLRFAVECELISILAGHECQDMAFPTFGRLPDPPEYVARTRAELPPADRRSLEAAEAEPAPENIVDDPASDEDQAAKLAYRFAGSRAYELVALCRAEARALIDVHHAVIGKLAGELLAHRILAGEVCRAILESEGATDADPD